jgi:hypothetical protein
MMGQHAMAVVDSELRVHGPFFGAGLRRDYSNRRGNDRPSSLYKQLAARMVVRHSARPHATIRRILRLRSKIGALSHGSPQPPAPVTKKKPRYPLPGLHFCRGTHRHHP